MGENTREVRPRESVRQREQRHHDESPPGGAPGQFQYHEYRQSARQQVERCRRSSSTHEFFVLEDQVKTTENCGGDE